ncbi:MAG: ATPase, T2SS/T4P/T4SS family [Pseudomonadota bacterium]
MSDSDITTRDQATKPDDAQPTASSAAPARAARVLRGDNNDRRRGALLKSSGGKTQGQPTNGGGKRPTLKINKEETNTPQKTNAASAATVDLGANQRSIKSLPFVDLYLRLDSEGEARFCPMAKKGLRQGNLLVPGAYKIDLERLRQQIVNIEKDDYSVIHDGMRLRGARRQISNGQIWTALRRVSDDVPTLEELRFKRHLIPHLKGVGKRTGLVIVSGATGHGKTTSCTALLSYFLKNYGHLAYTLEDPVEYQLQGEHGEGGYCFQTEIDKDADWAPGLKSALRWHPRYLLVGEIRSPDAANQVLRAATSGHLVLTTMHAGSIEETLNAIIQVAEQALGNRATQLLADGLVCVLHQTLRSWGPFVRFLFTEPDNPGDPVRACIRDNKVEQLGTYIAQQETIVFGPDAYEARQRDKARA